MKAQFKITLAAARVNANLTQLQMSKLLNVSKSTVNNWENGKTSPNYSYVKKISSITGIPIERIFLPDILR